MGKKVPIKIRKNSGFDKSFQNIFTSKPGTIVPILVDELMPNSRVHLKVAIQASLPPLAFDTFMRVSLKVQAFFVPTRLLVGSFEDFYSGAVRTALGYDYHPAMPYLYHKGTNATPGSAWKAVFANGSLMDYLGVRGLDFNTGAGTDADLRLSLLPVFAYHRIYQDWFRNTLVQQPVFSYPPSDSYSMNYTAFAPHLYFNEENNNGFYDMDSLAPSDSEFDLADGHNLFSLRQCNFPDDMFTLAQPLGSQAASNVQVIANQFTIPAVRMANALQRYSEIKQLAGPRYLDELAAQHGAHLSSGIAQRVLLLGSDEFEVYSKGIYQQSGSAATQNPFTSTGARYGDAIASGQGSLIENFTAEEPGYLFVMAELVPRVTYSTGVAPHMLRYTNGLASGIGDLANPVFEGIGNEAIPVEYLLPYRASSIPGIFGYGERFLSWKTRVDELHGIVRDGDTLDAMVLQRSFQNASYGVNSAFLQVPTTYLDQITAVAADVSNYGYWCDAFFKYGVSMPLKPYALPCLEESDEEHQRSVMVDVSGSHIS